VTSTSLSPSGVVLHVRAELAPPAAPISRGKLCPAQPSLVGAQHVYPKLRRAVPVSSFTSTLPVNISPLYAMLTKNEGVLPNARRSSPFFVGAQFIAPSLRSLPIQPRAANASHPRRESTAAVMLTPLYATLTKSRGVLLEP